MEILRERHLTCHAKNRAWVLSNPGFHFLGIYYPPTRTEDNTDATHVNDVSMSPPIPVDSLTIRGGVDQNIIIRRMSLYELFRTKNIA